MAARIWLALVAVLLPACTELRLDECGGGGTCGASETCTVDDDCDDENACTQDTCAAGTCNHDPLTEGVGCDPSCGSAVRGSCTLRDGELTCVPAEPLLCGCGDGVRQRGRGEVCDDGNDVSGDGCDATCMIEDGWSCDPDSAYCCAPETRTPHYVDADGDGWGIGPATLRCRAALGWAEAQGDCDDTRQWAHPTAAEITDDMLDDDCDGATDEVLDQIEEVAVGYGELAPVACARTRGRVVCWGDTIPPVRPWEIDAAPRDMGVEGVIDLDCGFLGCCALTPGRYHCFGYGTGGPPGVFDSGGVSLEREDATQIEVGDTRLCVLYANGQVGCWGRFGAFLNDRDGVGSSWPGATSLAIGQLHDCWIDSTNMLSCGGDGATGALGFGPSVTSGNGLVQLTGSEGMPTQVSAGGAHSCAVIGGDLYCWGESADGRLGLDPDRGDQFSPVLIERDVDDVDVGFRSTCFRRRDELWCTGWNQGAELGLGDAMDRISFTRVEGISIASVSVGERMTCAVETSGHVRCWGDHDSLGNGARWNALPARAAQGFANVRSLAMGSTTVCALNGGASVSCMGRNLSGSLGLGLEADAIVPTPGVVLAGALELDVRFSFACARTMSELRCWGANEEGQVLYPFSSSVPAPLALPSLPANVTQVALSGSHGCLTSAEGVFCWGRPHDGESFGFGGGPVPTQVPDLGSASQVSVGPRVSCAVREGRVFCWGSGAGGLFFDGDEGMHPVTALEGPDDVEAVTVDYFSACARRTSGGVVCWGRGENFLPHGGYWGNDERVSAGLPSCFDPMVGACRPQPVAGLVDAVDVVSAEGRGFCARREAGDVVCWGLPLDRPTTAPSPVPRVIAGLSGTIDLAANATSVCGVRADGTVACAGQPPDASLGLVTRPGARVAAP